MKALLALAGYAGSVIAGVWAVDAIGVVPVGFGLMAPAAVYFVGLTLVLRDIVHELAGPLPAVGAVIGAAALSYLISPSLAFASAVAFLASELLDLIIFSKVRARSGLVAGVLASNAVSIVIDSLIFLTLAFGSLAFLPGQIVGKAAATLAAAVVLALLDRRRAVAA